MAFRLSPTVLPLEFHTFRGEKMSFNNSLSAIISFIIIYLVGGVAAYAIVFPSKFIKGIFGFIEKILDRIENKKVK